MNVGTGSSAGRMITNDVVVSVCGDDDGACHKVYRQVDVVVKIADHSETSDNMGQGMAEREPGNVANGVKKLFDL